MRQVALRIRQLREDKRLSIRALAEQAGVSASALSQIESSQVSPSVATLQKICGALELPIAALFYEPDGGSRPLIMRANARRQVYSAESHAIIEPLARGSTRNKMQPLLLTLEPGGQCDEHPYTSVEGEEFAIVLRGRILFEQENAVHEFGIGDALYFNPHLPHNWRNNSEKIAKVLIVVAQ
jgi:transcriptional regulator with XRE-family HTH domain